MKHILIIICLATLCFSCQDRRIGGITIEVEGTVFTDSTETEPLVGAEVVLVESHSSLVARIIIAGATRSSYDEVESTVTDSLGNYNLSTVTEEEQSYFVWLKTDYLNYASSERWGKLSERRANTVDLHPENLIPVSLEISADSVSDENLEKSAGTLIIEGWQDQEVVDADYLELSIDVNWSGDTIIPLYVDTTYTLDIQYWPRAISPQSSSDLNHLFWQGSIRDLEPQDTLTITMQRNR